VITPKKIPMFLAHTNAIWPALNGSARIKMTIKITMITPIIFDGCKCSPHMPKKSPHSDNALTEVTGLACPRTPTRSRISASLSLLAERP
jgi:hypothetical protein